MPKTPLSRFSRHLAAPAALAFLAACGGGGGSSSSGGGGSTTTAPAIATPPANQSVTAGATASFSVVATGSAPLSYQWSKNGTAIGGATSASYTTPATSLSDNGASFSVKVSNAAGSASAAATLTVTAPAGTPSITTPPVDQSVTVGQTASFSVVASGSAPLSYQWSRNGTAIGGATSATYTTPATTAGDNGATFTVKVSNSLGSATGGPATLTVNAVASGISILSQPASQSTTVGQSATFVVVATGSGALSYQWKKGSANISGATDSSYTTPAAVIGDNGSSYSVVIHNGAASLASSAATLSVSASGASISPSSVALPPGQTLDFTTTVVGKATPNLTWTVLEAGGGYLEALSGGDGLYTAPATPGTYHLKAQDSGGASATATIVVLPPAASIRVSLSPAAIALHPGQSVAFTATVANDPNQTVGWAVVEAGGGSVDDSGNYVAPSTPGLYHIVAWSQDNGSAIGEAAVQVSASTPPASISVSPGAADVAPGQQQAFSAALFNAGGAVSWSVTEGSGGGSISASGLYTAPATPGSYHVHAAAGSVSADVPVTVVAPVSTREPRLWLDAATLSAVRARAAANSSAWQALKARCDTYLAGPANLPDGNAYPDTGVGQGYQGSDYYEAVLDLGLAYQALKSSNPTAANAYAAKGVEVLMAMSIMDAHGQPPSTDDGYGIRFYVTGMALGLDWLHDQLTAPQRQQLFTAMGNWIAFFEQSGFENGIPPGIANPPNGNYFAGYYAAKALASLSAEGEDPQAPARWTDWLDRVHGRMVQPDYAAFMAGGGAPEGWNYSPFATKNMIYPTLAAKTAKGLDLVHDAAKPFAFPYDQGEYLIQFTWPSRLTLDDRGTLYNSDNPAAAQVGLSSALAYLQGALGAPSAPYVHKYARDIRGLQGNDGSYGLWEDLLFWDDAAPESDYTTLPLSYLASGNGEVAMRSSWATDAVWCSFRSAPYIANGGGGHEYFDQGGPAIVRGGTPFLVNSTGELERNTPGLSDGGSWDDNIYDDLFNTKVRDIFNVFYVKTASGDYGQAAYDPTVASTSLTHYEDGHGYVRMRGEKLEELYRPGGPASGGAVSSWTRDLVYLRPQLFVFYDRTTASTSTADQWMAWHFGKIPVEGSAPQAGTHRWDISYNGTYAGAMTTLLPANNTTTLVNVFGSSKLYRVELRPGAQAAGQQWLTVFDASASSGAVEKATRLSAADGNVSSGAVQGVLLQGSSANQAVLFGTGAAGSTVSGTIRFTVPAVATVLVITDLPPNTAYAASAAAGSGGLNVSAAPGSGFTTTANGTLYLSLSAAGAVSAGP